eukprot:2058415-Pleurochrysis_carterae.AAC.1
MQIVPHRDTTELPGYFIQVSDTGKSSWVIKPPRSEPFDRRTACTTKYHRMVMLRPSLACLTLGMQLGRFVYSGGRAASSGDP